MDIPLILGVVGLLVISVAVWIRDEKQQDLFFILGGICLLVYSISLKSIIFSILQLVFISSSFIELMRKDSRKKDEISSFESKT